MRAGLKEIIKNSTTKIVRLVAQAIEDYELKEIIAYLIKKQPKIKHLSLEKNFITDNGAKILASGLVPLARNHLDVLDLEYNRIDKKGFEILTHSLLLINRHFVIYFYANLFRNDNEACEIQEKALEDKKRESFRKS